MSPITATLQDLQLAEGVPGILSAACRAFEGALGEIRSREAPASPAFAALVMAAASVADGRDAVLRAPSLPWPLTWPAAPEKPLRDGPTGRHPGDLAAVLRLLAARLDEAASMAAGSGDQAACYSAARSARTARTLLAGGSR